MINKKPKLTRQGLFFVILLIALAAFEVFNYSSTDRSLAGVIGNFSIFGISWSTLLAVAFCGVDLAGLAKMFTPETGVEEPTEVWYLFVVWLIAAIINAGLTWWGVAVAIATSPDLPPAAAVNREFVLNVFPVLLAVMVFLIRLLLIGTVSSIGDRLFSEKSHRPEYRPVRPPVTQTQSQTNIPPVASTHLRPASSFQKQTYNNPPSPNNNNSGSKR